MTALLPVNLPQTVAAVTAAFEDYERGLVANELATLDSYFWDSPHTVRYGVAENLYGAKAIAAYRRICQPVSSKRRLRNTVVSTYGQDYATVSTEFSDGETQFTGRQMQTWVRMGEQWKVVAAHVSVNLGDEA